jgi:hypothetical protein
LTISDLLSKNRNAILKRWFDLILETYPSDAATLMKKDRDAFTNPVGSTILREIEILFSSLCEGCDAKKMSGSLDSILKIRSVQDFSPSKAVEFVFLLKRAIGEVLKGDIEREGAMEEWQTFKAKIDDMALQAFDIYVDCREKIYEIRAKQTRAEKEMAFKMMERMTRPKGKGETEGS